MAHKCDFVCETFLIMDVSSIVGDYKFNFQECLK